MHDLTFEILARYAEPLHADARLKEVERLKGLGETPEQLYCSLYANQTLCSLVQTGLYKTLVSQIADKLSIKNTEDIVSALLFPFTVEMNWTEYTVASGMLPSSAMSVRNDCGEIVLSAKALWIPNKFLSDILGVMMSANSLNTKDIAHQWDFISAYRGYNTIPVVCYIYREYLLERELFLLEIDKVWYQFDTTTLFVMDREALEAAYILSTLFMYPRRLTEYAGTRVTCGKGMVVTSPQFPDVVPSGVLYGHMLCNSCKLFERLRLALPLHRDIFETKFRSYRENQTTPFGNVLFYKGSRLALTSVSFDILVSVYEGKTVLTINRIDTPEVMTTEVRYWRSINLSKSAGAADAVHQILSEYMTDEGSIEECLERIMKVRIGAKDV